MTIKRVAVYARYSSDLQSPNSVDDQIALCERYAEQFDWRIDERISDAGISGASVHGRNGYARLVAAIETRSIDIVLAEATDRLSRNLGDLARLYDLASFNGIEIWTVADSLVSTMHVGLKGLMSSQFLADLKAKTHRGLSARAREGQSAGGRSYGYTIIPKTNERGERIAGERRIDDAEAATIRRIFALYAEGQSGKAIAERLNADSIPSPTSGEWSHTTINGNRARGTGILNNELYIGRQVWNRLEYRKDPSTGRRVSRLKPQSEWIASDVPALRIVSDEDWQAVKARQEEHAARLDPGGRNPQKAKRPSYLLSGLVRCGLCGGGAGMISATHLGCSRARNKRTCANRLSIARTRLEDFVLDALTEELLQPEHVDLYCEAVDQYQRERRNGSADAVRTRQRDLQSVNRRIDNWIKAIGDGASSPAILSSLERDEARKLVLEQELKELEALPPAPVLHPRLADGYRHMVRRLRETLETGNDAKAAHDAVRAMIDHIDLVPTSAVATRRSYVHPVVTGSLEAILESGARATGDTGVSGSVLCQQVTLVAGAGFEPATFRL